MAVVSRKLEALTVTARPKTRKIQAEKLHVSSYDSKTTKLFDVVVECRKSPFSRVFRRNNRCQETCRICEDLHTKFSHFKPILHLHAVFKLVSTIQNRYAFNELRFEIQGVLEAYFDLCLRYVQLLDANALTISSRSHVTQDPDVLISLNNWMI
ncbi:hypothetical protein PENTCL1PPCAC_21620, partial [Pristionchus entomophagus]